MHAMLGIKVTYLTRSMLGGDPVDNVTEEAEDRSLGHVDFLARWRAKVNRRLDERSACRVEFENRVCVGAETCHSGREVGAIAAGDG